MDIEQIVQRVGAIDVEIERLQDERAEVVSGLERAANKIASARGNLLSRTTESAQFASSKDGEVVFDVFDGYDNERGSSFTCSYADLLDPEVAVERIAKLKVERKKQELQARLERTRAQLADLQAQADMEES